MTIDTRTPALEEAEDDGSKATLTFLNLTDGRVELSAKPQERAACVPTLDETNLEPAENTPVVVSIPAVCKASEGLVIDLIATAGSTELANFKVIPEVKPAEDLSWHNLRAFPIAWAAILVLLALFLWMGWKPAKGVTRSPFQRLHLDATWKFNDNWATNVSAIGAILTGVFSATTAKSFLGPDAESEVALATVGAAIALGLVAAGPVIALATKTFKVVPVVKDGKPVMKNGKPKGERWDSFTVGGMLLAASVIFASAFGQLWVVMKTGEKLKLDGLEDYMCIPFGLAGALLLLYGWRSLKDLLERNTQQPEDDDPVEIKAAMLIAAAIAGKAGAVEGAPAEDANAALKALEEEIAAQTATGGASYAQRQRSVLP